MRRPSTLSSTRTLPAHTSRVQKLNAVMTAPRSLVVSDQLLMEAAEKRWHSALGDIFRSVPQALWRLASHTGSLVPQEEPSRSPGFMFVEEGGANRAVAQAMLTLVFRIIRCGGKPGSLGAPSLVDTGLRAGTDISSQMQEAGGGGQEGKTATTTRPWTTAAEALTATAAATAVGDAESWLGFAGRLVRLFSDQDDALVDMLLTNLYIFHDTRPAVSATATRRKSPSLDGVSSGTKRLPLS